MERWIGIVYLHTHCPLDPPKVGFVHWAYAPEVPTTRLFYVGEGSNFEVGHTKENEDSFLEKQTDRYVYREDVEALLGACLHLRQRQLVLGRGGEEREVLM